MRKAEARVGLVTNYLARIANFTRSVSFKNSLQCLGNIRKVGWQGTAYAS